MNRPPLEFVLRGRDYVCPPYRLSPTPSGYVVHYDGRLGGGELARGVTLAQAKAVCEADRGVEG